MLVTAQGHLIDAGIISRALDDVTRGGGTYRIVSFEIGHTVDQPSKIVMDVAAPMLHRVDGHLDRLHYCLPGPPDFYSHALFNYMLDE